MRLFRKTIRRTYTPEWKARWNSRDDETSAPVWAESAEAVRDAHKPSLGAYWDERFQDVLVSVEPMDHEAEKERMLRADRSNQRCCDEAVLRPCVCVISFSCAEHGARCIGGHD